MAERVQSQAPHEVMNFPRCIITDIDWYMRMLTDPLPVDPKVEMLPKLCEEEANLEPSFSMIESELPH